MSDDIFAHLTTPDNAEPSTTVFDHLAAPEQSMSTGTTRAAAQGLTFGFADELEALARQPFSRRSYKEIRDEIRSQNERFYAEHPYAAYSADLGSSFFVPLGAASKIIKGGMTLRNLARDAIVLGAPVGAANELGRTSEELTTPSDVAATAGEGALKGAGAFAVAAPIMHGVLRGSQAISHAIGDARDPHGAAVRKLAENLAEGELDPRNLRGLVVKPTSRQLSGRGFDDQQMSDMINRVQNGENIKDVAASMGIAPTTVGKYVNHYTEQTAIPSNVFDLSGQLARLEGRAGAEESVMNLGRAAASQSGQGPAIAAQRLYQRQMSQGDRAMEHVAAITKGDPDEIAAGLTETLGAKSKAAYETAHKVAKPFNIWPAISAARERAFSSAGAIKDKLNRGIDLFFEPENVNLASGVIGLGSKKLGSSISDTKRYTAAREALDDMISAETDSVTRKMTRAGAALSEFRKSMNEIVRAANPELARADDMYSGARKAQELMKRGQEMPLQLTAASRRELADLAPKSAKNPKGMTEEQIELFRLGFRTRLENAIANKSGEAVDVVRQFRTPAAKHIIRGVLGKAEAEKFLSRIEREAATTRTAKHLFSGSRTSPLSQQSEQFLADANIAAKAATGNIGGLLSALGQKITYHIGNRQSKEILEMATQTDPKKLLPILDEIIAKYHGVTGVKAVRGYEDIARRASGLAGGYALEEGR